MAFRDQGLVDTGSCWDLVPAARRRKATTICQLVPIEQRSSPAEVHSAHLPDSCCPSTHRPDVPRHGIVFQRAVLLVSVPHRLSHADPATICLFELSGRWPAGKPKLRLQDDPQKPCRINRQPTGSRSTDCPLMYFKRESPENFFFKDLFDAAVMNRPREL